MKRVLHVGCGMAQLPPGLIDEPFVEVRVDIDPAVRPDVVASIADMGAIESGGFDVVWSSHNLEHLYAHEVPVALGEILRVLRPGGWLWVIVPDVQQVAAVVAEGNLTGELYQSPSGPVAAIDVLWGFRPALAAGHECYSHRSGFTAGSLQSAIEDAGFREVSVARDENSWALFGKGQR